MSENEPNGTVATRRMLWRVAGLILFAAIVASWVVWGPLGLIFYLGGRINSLSVFMLALPFSLLVFLAAIFLPILGIRSIFRWRRFSGRKRVLSFLLMIALAALVTSTGLGFAGMTPSLFDMFVQGFSKYVESRADVTAIQSWLGTLDPNEYTDKYGAMTEKFFVDSEQPSCIARLHPKTAKVQPDDKGRLIV